MKRLSILCVLVFGISVAGAEPPQKPNVLFIAVDDLRDWVGYLGRNPQTITPNLDKLAAESGREVLLFSSVTGQDLDKLLQQAHTILQQVKAAVAT